MPRSALRAFACEVRELRRMSAWWREWAVDAGFAGEVLDDGELCLNEVVGNILQHGEGQPTSSIEILLDHSADAVRMTIADGLGPFNPLEYPPHAAPASLEEARAGGLGIHLIRAHATHIRYQRDHGRNVLTLVFSR